jgi:hypothetical protein
VTHLGGLGTIGAYGVGFGISLEDRKESRTYN